MHRYFNNSNKRGGHPLLMSLTMSQLEAKKVEETIFINFIVPCFLEGCPTWRPKREGECMPYFNVHYSL
jgi:hypothetical protein